MARGSKPTAGTEIKGPATEMNPIEPTEPSTLAEEVDWRAEAQRWKDAHGFAASELAQIHFLALGEITPVKRGVVEDVEEVLNGLRARVAELEAAQVQHAGAGSASAAEDRDLTVEAYKLFRKSQTKGEFPAWEKFDPQTQKLWRDGYNYVANGGAPRTDYEHAVRYLIVSAQ